MKHYLFDLDDNLLYLDTAIMLRNTKINDYSMFSTGEFRDIKNKLGVPGKWEDWTIFSDSFKNFEDDSIFLSDLSKAKLGPSWPLFVHAINNGRPVSIITARGVTPQTIQTGIEDLCVYNDLPTPIWHYIDTISQHSVVDERNTMPVLKKRSINKCITKAIIAFGPKGQTFGMSDDDPDNIGMIIRGMKEAKDKYPENRYFVIDSKNMIKMEIFGFND